MDSDLPDREQGLLVAGLDRWVAAGLMTDDQARRIADWERDPDHAPAAPAAPAPVMSLAAEALAYVGGAVVIAAIAIVASGYWDRLGFGSHLAIPAAATVLLLAAGASVPRTWAAVGVRMRAALWLTAPAALFALLAVIGEHAHWSGDRSMLFVSAPLFVATAVLWLIHRAAPQQIAAFVALELLGVAATNITIGRFDALAGASMAVIAIAWGACARGGLLPGGGRWAPPAQAGPAAAALKHQRGQRRWGLGLGTGGAALGGIVLAGGWDTSWMGVIPIVVIVAAGVAIGDLPVLIVAAIGTVIVLPMVAERYTQSTLATAVVLLIVGAAMVALAILVARRQTRRHTRSADADAAIYSR
ncbi:MAG: hypothetical protein BGO26_08875 [Actinobacteria bacterium 69-20]|jgi:hypothetical protein|nr:DUF2157 domain-containing protein [Actinomycetota bacterium]OJV25804.1 MAG: hypothetical protein BGO26_08875 [Actinobacteria bacterium 69-20]